MHAAMALLLFPDDQYIGESPAPIPHLLYSSCLCKVMRDLGLRQAYGAQLRAPFDSGIVQKAAVAMSKSKCKWSGAKTWLQKYGVPRVVPITLFAGSPEKEP